MAASQPRREATGKLLALSRTECLELLSTQEFGRLAVNLRDAAPVVRPVNYVFDAPSQSVVFRTARGSKLFALLHSAEATFEIDGIEPGDRSGWSVVVCGPATEVTHPAELARLERLELQPWFSGPFGHWVQIRARTVSGRRIVVR